MQDFSVAPFDQNLFVDGVLLEGNGLTLGELGVLPRSLVSLRVDEPAANGSGGAEAEFTEIALGGAAAGIEEGFKGGLNKVLCRGLFFLK